MKRGDIVEFKVGGRTSGILSRILKFFERDWDRWGWHLGIAYEKSYDGWYIMEATGEGTQTHYYPTWYLEKYTRSYKWFDRVPNKKKMAKFREGYVGKKYDVAVYFWTALQYIIRHYFNRRIPRLLDDRFTCWELVGDFCEYMGKPIQSKYDCPILTDILKELKNG